MYFFSITFSHRALSGVAERYTPGTRQRIGGIQIHADSSKSELHFHLQRDERSRGKRYRDPEEHRLAVNTHRSFDGQWVGYYEDRRACEQAAAALTRELVDDPERISDDMWLIEDAPSAKYNLPRVM